MTDPPEGAPWGPNTVDKEVQTLSVTNNAQHHAATEPVADVFPFQLCLTEEGLLLPDSQPESLYDPMFEGFTHYP